MKPYKQEGFFTIRPSQNHSFLSKAVLRTQVKINGINNYKPFRDDCAMRRVYRMFCSISRQTRTIFRFQGKLHFQLHFRSSPARCRTCWAAEECGREEARTMKATVTTVLSQLKSHGFTYEYFHGVSLIQTCIYITSVWLWIAERASVATNGCSLRCAQPIPRCSGSDKNDDICLLRRYSCPYVPFKFSCFSISI